MDELSRRRMLWIALVASAGFFLLTMLLAATGGLTTGWYLVGAVVYGLVFLLAIYGFVTERVEANQAASPSGQAVYLVAAQPSTGNGKGNGNGNGHGNGHGEARSMTLRESVIYSTPTGQVLELEERDGDDVQHDYLVESGPTTVPVSDIENYVDRLDLQAGEPPSDDELRTTLLRWGRIREVS